MSRSRDKGTAFERHIADYLAAALDDDRIDRRARNGAKDRGDIGGVRIHGQRLVIECKSCSRQALPEWTAEAEIERGNDDALAGIVISKRKGTTNPADQWVHMTVTQLVTILTGERIPE